METKNSLIILFGSQASGKAGRISDIDIAVLADHPLSLQERGEIAESVSKELHAPEDNIDIVDLWSASPLLQHEVASKGRLLGGDNVDFLRFKVLAWKRYLDTAKLRRLREKILEKEYGQ